MKVEEDLQLERFGRHIPHILANQISLSLVDQFINQNGEESTLTTAYSPLPTITRFHGALLFVDISGFTALSQRLPVDELRKHINGYFKKILDIVVKYEGDVIKFAGDAIFIVFQTKLGESGCAIDHEAQKAVVKSAVGCGLEINQQCSNYRINFQFKDSSSKGNDSDEMLMMLPEALTKSSKDYAILNVHAGVSVGMMAGMDVGAFDRWEYLLFGTPLTDVAEAEGEAEAGDLVLSALAHDLLCGDHVGNPAAKPAEGTWSCGCIRTTNGLFKTKDANPSPPISEKTHDHHRGNEEEGGNFEFFEYTMNNTLRAFENMKKVIMRKYNEICTIELLEESPMVSRKQMSSSTSGPALQRLQQQKEQEELVFNYFLNWVSSCLLHDIAGHVHEADRVNFQMTNINRTNSLVYCYKELTSSTIRTSLSSPYLQSPGQDSSGSFTSPNREATMHRLSFQTSTSGNVKEEGSGRNNERSSDHYRTPPDGGSGRIDGNTTFVGKLRGATRHQRHSMRDRFQRIHDKTLQTDRDMHGELRNVIVMFIKIVINPAATPTSRNAMHLYMDEHREDCSFFSDLSQIASQKFHFLRRSHREYEADMKLLNQYQACMTRVVKGLHDHGGQLRQFIIDDKGTVCIGTFGLRGAVSSDNAAAAIEAAKNIIGSLRSIDMEASIGITSGKAYCGIVGSPKRHEYAVMGPSTNLSARLMAKSRAGEILCDNSLKMSDRTHYFKKMGEIKAKGYADLVPIYQPSLLRGSTLMFIPDAISTDSYHPPPNANLMINIALAINAVAGIENENTQSGVDSPKFSSTPHNLQAPSASPTVESSHMHGHQIVAKTPGSKIKSLKNQIWGREKQECAVIMDVLQTLLSGSAVMNKSKEVLESIALAIQTNTMPMNIDPSLLKDIQLSTQAPVKLVLLEGSNGIGKSSLINQIGRKLERFKSHFHGWNLVVFHGKSSSVNDMDPFKPWRSVIRHLLTRYASLGGYKSHTANSEVSLPTHVMFPKHNDEHSEDSERNNHIYERWKAGAQHISKYLTDEQRQLLPLLTSAHIIPGLSENDITSKLSGTQKLSKVVVLLNALLHHFPKLTSKVLIIVFDDLQNTDNHSLQLLHDCWLHNKGVIILTTLLKVIDNRIFYNEDLGADLSNARNSSQKIHRRLTNSFLMTQLESFSAHPDKYLKMTLDALDEFAMKQMIDQILNAYDINKEISNEAYTQMYSMSGGNPLYVYELTLSMIKYYFENFKQEFFAEMSCKINRDVGVNCPFLATLSNFHTSRLDEVIYYRFDQLDAKSQLLLKFASVIVSRGSHQGFTLKMLLSMLHGQQQSNNLFANLEYDELGEILPASAGEIIGFLQGLVHSDEFIRIIPNSRRTSTASSVSGSSYSVPSQSMSVRSGMHSLRQLTESSEFVENAIHAAVDSLTNSSATAIETENPFVTSNSMKQRETLASYQEVEGLLFDFKVEMECQTIYDLMLDDQKESLHDRVACFLERENAHKKQNQDKLSRHQYINLLTPSDYIEEGFHWEKAHIWGNAMICYYEAAMLLDRLGAYQESFEYLSLAYQMLLGMRRAANVKETFQTLSFTFLIHIMRSHGIEVDSFAMFKTMNVADMKKKYSDRVAASPPTKEGTLISKFDVFKTFGGDVDLFETGLQVLVKLGQTSFTLEKPIAFCARLFDEALQMIVVTWKNYSLSAPSIGEFSRPPSGRALRAEAADDASAGSSEHRRLDRLDSARSFGSANEFSHFSLPNNASAVASFGLRHPAVVFPILAGVAAMYRRHRLQDDEAHSKETILYDLILYFASELDKKLQHITEEGVEITTNVHYLQGICLKNTLHFDAPQAAAMIDITEELIAKYRPEIHSHSLIETYGNDRIPYTIAMNCQWLLLKGYIIRCEQYLKYLMNTILPGMTHLHSLGIVTIPLCSIFRLVHQPTVYCTLFEEYRSMELERTHQVYSFFQDTNVFVAEWARIQEEYRSVLLHEQSSGGNANSLHHNSEVACLNEEDEDVTQALHKSIIEKKFLIPKNTDLITTTTAASGVQKRSLASEVAESFGLGMEYVCANILYILAKLQFHNHFHKSKTVGQHLPEGRRLLYIAIDYLNASISYCTDVPKLQYSLVMASLMKVEICLTLHQWYITHAQLHPNLHSSAYLSDHKEVVQMLFGTIESIWQVAMMDDLVFVQYYLHILHSFFASSLSSAMAEEDQIPAVKNKLEEIQNVMKEAITDSFLPLLAAIQNVEDMKMAILCLQNTAELAPAETYLNSLVYTFKKVHSNNTHTTTHTPTNKTVRKTV